MEWRKIPGIDFSVSDTGLVRNDNTNKLRKFSVNKGYHYVTLHINGKSKNFEEVVIKTGTNISSLSSALHGRYHTANGYHWKFYNEEEVKCAND